MIEHGLEVRLVGDVTMAEPRRHRGVRAEDGLGRAPVEGDPLCPLVEGPPGQRATRAWRPEEPRLAPVRVLDRGQGLDPARELPEPADPPVGDVVPRLVHRHPPVEAAGEEHLGVLVGPPVGPPEPETRRQRVRLHQRVRARGRGRPLPLPEVGDRAVLTGDDDEPVRVDQPDRVAHHLQGPLDDRPVTPERSACARRSGRAQGRDHRRGGARLRPRRGAPPRGRAG